MRSLSEVAALDCVRLQAALEKIEPLLELLEREEVA